MRGAGNAGGNKQGLGEFFVHASGRSQDAVTDVWQARQLEETLNSAVFAERAVQNWENHVNLTNRTSAGCVGHGQFARTIERKIDLIAFVFNHGELTLAQLPLFGVIRSKRPLARLSDADRHNLILVAVNSTEHSGSGCARNGVFARLATKNECYTNLCHRLSPISRARNALFALWLVGVVSQVRRDVARVHLALNHQVDLLDDWHLNTLFGSKLQHRCNRGEALCGL